MPSTSALPLQKTQVSLLSKPESGIKSILFLVHQDEGLERRLQAALDVARTCSAHLDLLHVVPVEAYTVTDLFSGAGVGAGIMDILEEEAGELQARVERQLRDEDVSWTYRRTTSVLIPELLADAAFADLVIMGRAPERREYGRNAMGMSGQYLMRSSTPLLVPGDEAARLDVEGKALIAWNGSFEAANAVRSAIGLLQIAADVRVISYAEVQTDKFPSFALLDYLARHGISAELDVQEPESDIAANLVTYGRTLGASYLLIGGYGHSRAGEYLFGGITRELLRGCPLPLIMAH